VAFSWLTHRLVAHSITFNKTAAALETQKNLETYDVQVFALQETWLKEDESFFIPGFNIMRIDELNGYRGHDRYEKWH
jgi:hypothetical protein